VFGSIFIDREKLSFPARVKEHFQAALLHSDPDMTPDPSEKRVLHSYCNLVEQIGSSSHTLGKDGKFQLFVCLCARCVPLPYHCEHCMTCLWK
jgi:hypothetical protein